MHSEKGNNVKIQTSDGNVVVEIYSINRMGDNLIMDAKVLDSMRMDMIITSKEVFNAARMLLPISILYVMLLPFWCLKKRLVRKQESLHQ